MFYMKNIDFHISLQINTAASLDYHFGPYPRRINTE